MRALRQRRINDFLICISSATKRPARSSASQRWRRQKVSNHGQEAQPCIWDGSSVRTRQRPEVGYFGVAVLHLDQVGEVSKRWLMVDTLAGVYFVGGGGRVQMPMVKARRFHIGN